MRNGLRAWMSHQTTVCETPSDAKAKPGLASYTARSRIDRPFARMLSINDLNFLSGNGRRVWADPSRSSVATISHLPRLFHWAFFLFQMCSETFVYLLKLSFVAVCDGN